MNQCAADFAERIAAEHFAVEAHLQTVAERTPEPHVVAGLRTGGSEPAVQRTRCSGGRWDWVASSDGTPDSVARESR